jgi:hypothetical protein
MPFPVALSRTFPVSEPPNPEKLRAKLVCADKLKIYALKKINNNNDFIESAFSVYYGLSVVRTVGFRNRKKKEVHARHDEAGMKKQINRQVQKNPGGMMIV